MDLLLIELLFGLNWDQTTLRITATNQTKNMQRFLKNFSTSWSLINCSFPLINPTYTTCFGLFYIILYIFICIFINSMPVCINYHKSKFLVCVKHDLAIMIHSKHIKSGSSILSFKCSHIHTAINWSVAKLFFIASSTMWWKKLPSLGFIINT